MIETDVPARVDRLPWSGFLVGARYVAGACLGALFAIGSVLFLNESLFAADGARARGDRRAACLLHVTPRKRRST
jgi:hypothetical protein